MNENEILNKIKEETNHISVPASLQPNQVEKNLADTKQKNIRFYRSPKSILALAACLLFVIVAGTVIYPYTAEKETVLPERNPAVADNGPSVTYEEVCTLINDYNSDRYSPMAAKDLAGESTGAAGAIASEDAAVQNNSMAESKTDSENSSDYSKTDMQVEGIAEGDIVKTDGNCIYTVKETTTGVQITIYRANGGNTKQISEIPVSGVDYRELHLEGNHLILIGESWQNSYAGTEADTETATEEYDYYDRRSHALTNIVIYDISNPEKPQKLTELTQSGNFGTTRISDGYLYTFSNYRVGYGECNVEEPEKFVPYVNGKIMEEKEIELVGEKGSNKFLVMTSLSLDSPDKFTDSLATLGGGETYYMNDVNIYATQSFYQQGLFGSGQRTSIARYSYRKGKFEYQARTQIRGSIESSYYMHEYKGNFCFVYTRYTNSSSTNGLCVMDENLKLLGELSDLGVDERIYSSYYIDNMSYFVTYRETDPVFAVDISDPKKPVLKSELKLPGFSSYLHSFGENKLLGIGEYDTKFGDGGVKFSLFTIGKNYKITETAKEKLAEDSGSIADENHKAVLVDEERALFGLGIESWDSSEYVVYRYADKKFKKVLSVKVKSDIEEVRGIRIGEIFYVVDVNKSITAYDMNTWKKL
ncbi:MAG: beta-propeller domain-containing protein [Lachnospiraceae bacterium]|nr:beta-propeller domain-containing protein [Lachnospiraceae bacterium]